jgi:hypothetical protein
MRLFEIILLIAATFFPFFLSSKFFRKHKLAIISATVVLFLSHLLFEGFRWQLIPALVILLLSCILLYKGLKFMSGGRLLTTFKLLFLSIIIVIAWAFPIILPVFNLPTPTGKYKIGSRYLKVKADRTEIITANLNDKREFMVKVWYPSTLTNESKEHYLDKGNRLGFINKYGLPEFTLNYLDLVDTHTYEGPDLAQGKFPVLIFSHGSYSEAFGYYALMEEIVSHGFVVININHTYESSGAVFPNGDLKLYSLEFDQKTNDSEMAKMAWNANESYKKATTEKERLLAVENLIRNYVAAGISKRWSADISTVIDNLDKWNKNSFFNKHLDLRKIGVFGHSQGGSAVGQALVEDNRIDAGINLDGAQWGRVIDTTITKPFMLISSEWEESHPNLNKYAYRNLSPLSFKSIIIKNAGHSNFMDIPLLVNLPYINEAGTINPYKGYKIISQLILEFFDKNLNHKSKNLTDLVKKYKEIEVLN